MKADMRRLSALLMDVSLEGELPYFWTRRALRGAEDVFVGSASGSGKKKPKASSLNIDLSSSSMMLYVSILEPRLSYLTWTLPPRMLRIVPASKAPGGASRAASRSVVMMRTLATMPLVKSIYGLR